MLIFLNSVKITYTRRIATVCTYKSLQRRDRSCVNQTKELPGLSYKRNAGPTLLLPINDTSNQTGLSL